MAKRHKIEIVKATGLGYERGTQFIQVDDQTWGIIHMKNHGPAGNSFYFKQCGVPHIIHREIKSGLKRLGTRRMAVTVNGDKLHARSGGRPSPVADRLIGEVRKLIAEKLLVHPDTARAKATAGNERMHKEHTARRAEADKEFDDKAREVFWAVLKSPHESSEAKGVAIIVEAMKWAQTK